MEFEEVKGTEEILMCKILVLSSLKNIATILQKSFRHDNLEGNSIATTKRKKDAKQNPKMKLL